ncbi:MAG TPA: ATP-grasp domain-containing protein [Vicinamibacterales bacterium]|nr:ATP-grasp domain-containing protein [Vicinamibacterales bacterium]
MPPSAKRLNVLITAASRRVPLVTAFRRSLDELGIAGSIIVTDINPLSPAVYSADRAWWAPMADEPDYVDALMSICDAESIGLLVPTIDDELPVVGGARDRFARLGTRVAASDRVVAEVCNDKYETCRQLTRHGIAAAESFLPSELPSAPAFPLFVKPRRGRGGVGAFAARNSKELDFFLTYVQEPVVQQYLDGAEYTIDMLCDFDGRPLSVVPRERIVIRAGVTDRGRTVRNPALVELALACARVLRFVGAVNIQCRIVRGQPVVFEINPRFSGGIPLTIAAGADFPAMLIRLASGDDVPAMLGSFAPDVWMTNSETPLFLRTHQIARLVPGRALIKEVA